VHVGRAISPFHLTVHPIAASAARTIGHGQVIGGLARCAWSVHDPQRTSILVGDFGS